VTVEDEFLRAAPSLPLILSTIEPLIDSDVRQGILESVSRFTLPIQDGRRQTG
jgi:hypothetical protein